MLGDLVMKTKHYVTATVAIVCYKAIKNQAEQSKELDFDCDSFGLGAYLL